MHTLMYFWIGWIIGVLTYPVIHKDYKADLIDVILMIPPIMYFLITEWPL